MVSRLKREWEEERRTWSKRDLSGDRWVYLWADGIYSGLRGTSARLCVLVVIGVNERGEKHLLAVEDGARESTQSWRELLLGLKRRGLAEAPKLAVGDGATGFWGALEEVYGSTRQQRCWVHKTRNVLNYLPKSSQAKAKQALHEIWMAETREKAEEAFDAFLETYDDAYPKATNCLLKDREELLRLPQTALGASAHHQPDRVHLLHHPPADRPHQGLRQPQHHAGDDLQARNQRTAPLETPARIRPTRQSDPRCPFR